MIKNELLKENFINDVKKLILELRNNAICSKKNNNEDEAKLEKIKVNVAEIFLQMFNNCYNNIFFKKAIGRFEKYIELNVTKEKQFYMAYIDVIEGICNPWKEKLIKNKEFGLEDESIIEEIKIEIFNQVKLLFENHFQNIYGG